METQVTEAEAQKLVHLHGGYGTTRVYAVLPDGQKVGVKSHYHVEKYAAQGAAFIVKTNDGFVPVEKA